jgi:hypothetical protein
MALGSLVSLAFWTTRLAGGCRLFAEKLNGSNHICWPDGQAFPLPCSFPVAPSDPWHPWMALFSLILLTFSQKLPAS